MFEKIVLATENQGKLREIRQRVIGLPYEFVSLDEVNASAPDETGLSFVENAIIKARSAAKYSGLPTLADDSGLVVDVLNGLPGVRSARYAGEHVSSERHMAKLLSALDGVPSTARTATFICVLAFMRNSDDPCPVLFEASWGGMILEASQGEGGFGYDPIFYLPDHHCTAAELSPTQKAKISHRGQALGQFIDYLQTFAGLDVK